MEIGDAEVLPTTQEHLDCLKGNLREADEREVWAMGGITASAGLQMSFTFSRLCWTALYRGVPVLCFGVGPKGLFTKKGNPWLLGTDDIVKIKRPFFKYSGKYVQLMLEQYEWLENWVDVRNELSMKWLKWCGFEMGSPEPYGVSGELFRRFWMLNKGRVK